MQAVAALQEKGVVIQSIICDGKSGLLDSFPDIPVQMCQFHQIKIIMRHLTREPKSPKARQHRGCGPCRWPWRRPLRRSLKRRSSAGTSSTPPSWTNAAWTRKQSTHTTHISACAPPTTAWDGICHGCLPASVFPSCASQIRPICWKENLAKWSSFCGVIGGWKRRVSYGL